MSFFKESFRQTVAHATPFLSRLGAIGLRSIHATCSLSLIGADRIDVEALAKGRGIVAFWHCCFPAVAYYFRDHGCFTIISRSKDGDLAAGIARSLGYLVLRGSPGKGGAEAIRELIHAFKNSPAAGIVADGSKGPAQKAQMGLPILAKLSGHPIYPVSAAAAPCWRFRSWDRTVLARPFSNVAVACGAPVYVPSNSSKVQLEEYRRQLEVSLDSLLDEAREAASGRIAPGVRVENSNSYKELALRAQSALGRHVR